MVVPVPTNLDLVKVDTMDMTVSGAATYGTFDCTSQHICSNANGIFFTYLHSDSTTTGDDVSNWRLVRSTNKGVTWATLASINAANAKAPMIETDENNDVYVFVSSMVDNGSWSNSPTYLYKFLASANYAVPTPTTNISASAGKACTMYDQTRGRLYYLTWGAGGTSVPQFWALDKTGAVVTGFPKQLWSFDVNMYPMYSLMTLGSDGKLIAAWTNQDISAPNGATEPYYDNRFIYSTDGGATWIGTTGTLTLPISPIQATVADGTKTSPSWLITDSGDIAAVGTNQDNFTNQIALNGGYLSAVYDHAASTLQVGRRFNMSTLAFDKDFRPISGTTITPDQQGGGYVQDTSGSGRLFYVAGSATSGTAGHVGIIYSDNNGSTWNDAVATAKITTVSQNSIYALGTARNVQADGSIIGCFTLCTFGQAPADVYFFRAYSASISGGTVATNYPFGIDSFTTTFGELTDQTIVHAPSHNLLGSALHAVETDTRTGWGWRNVLHYGTAGVTGIAGNDSTAAVQAAINSLTGVGGTVLFPPGQYEITQVTIPAVEIQFQGFGASTLFHRGSAGTPMITNVTSTVSSQFTMEDLTVDGNKGTRTAGTGGGGTGTGAIYNGQPEATNTVLLTFGAGATFRNCRFQNWRHHSLDLIGANSRILIENCTFANGAEWGGTTGTDTTPLRFETNSLTTYEAAITNCSFEHGTPAVAGNQPGGIIIDAQGSNPPVRAVIMGCRFKNMGCRVSGTTVGSIYIYKSADGSSVSNNVFETPYFTAISVQNSSNFVVQNNRAICDTNLASAHVFSWQANERANNIQQYRVTFDSNVIQGGGATSEGIYVDSSGATTWPATDVIISNNHIQGVQHGVLLANCAGVAQVVNNEFADLTQSGVANALRIAGSRATSTGTIVFRGNYCDNLVSNPVGMDDVAYPTLTVRVEDNTFKNVADADAGLQFRGIELAVIRRNRWRGTPTTGAIMTLGGTNAVTTAYIDDNIHDALSTVTRTNVTNVFVRRNSWNPINVVTTPAFPATTVTATNTTGYDVMAYIVNGTSALTIAVQGVAAVMIIPASQTGSILIPAGATFTPTFGGGAPTWKWVGL